MNLKRTKKQWKQYNTNAVPGMSNEAITRDLRDAKADILELHRRVEQLEEMMADKSHGSLGINTCILV